MSTAVLNAVEVFNSPARTDAELVERFVVARDQAAFAELVHRHSSVVLGVCRRVLKDANDIEDVFQATFLVLVRDAARVRKRSSLSSWLYGVAYRLSLRVARTKQRRRETPLVDQTSTDTDLFESLANQHDNQLLDEELNALPERYRQTLVLKYLVGKSPVEIASELNTTIGTVEGLLKRGKVELRQRLLKRGITLGAALATFHCTQQAVQAAACQTLIENTIQVSLAWDWTSKTIPVDQVSNRAIELAGKEMIAMTATTKTTLAAGLIVGGLLAGWGGLGLISSQHAGTAEAAGIHTAISTISKVSHEIEMATFTAEATDKKDNAKPENEDVKTRSENDTQLGVNFGVEKVEGYRVVPATGPGISISSLNTVVDDTDAKVKKWDRSIRTPRVQKIEKALKSTVEVDFQEIPLKDGIDYLKSICQIEILFDDKAFVEEGHSRDSTVSLLISDVDLNTVLRLMLEPLNLDYVIKHDNLMITTATASESHMDVRVYDIRRTGINDQEALVKSITNTIKGEHVKWENIDGAGGVIQPLEKSLVIRQTQRVHEQIVDLFNQLEEFDLHK